MWWARAAGTPPVGQSLSLMVVSPQPITGPTAGCHSQRATHTNTPAHYNAENRKHKLKCWAFSK